MAYTGLLITEESLVVERKKRKQTICYALGALEDRGRVETQEPDFDERVASGESLGRMFQE